MQKRVGIKRLLSMEEAYSGKAGGEAEKSQEAGRIALPFPFAGHMIRQLQVFVNHKFRQSDDLHGRQALGWRWLSVHYRLGSRLVSHNRLAKNWLWRKSGSTTGRRRLPRSARRRRPRRKRNARV